MLETALKVHDVRKGSAQPDIGTSRRVPRTLEELEQWADRQDRIAQALAHAPDEDAGAAALGISKAMQAASDQISKSNTALPGDSAASLGVNVAEQMQRRASANAEVHKAAVAPHWSQRSRR